MILACHEGKKVIRVKENIVPFVISTLLENRDVGRALDRCPVPASSHTPSADRLEAARHCDSPGARESTSAGSPSVRPACLEQFFCEKRKDR